MIKEFLKVYRPDIVMLQKTKSALCDRSLIKSIWGWHFRKWAFLPSCGRSGGILIIWDERIVTECEMILGEFTLSIKFRNYNNSE